MIWPEVCKFHPDKWLVIEALEANTTAGNQRQLGKLAVTECCENGSLAMQRYRKLRQKFPSREFYFVHTSRKELDIRERNSGVPRS